LTSKQQTTLQTKRISPTEANIFHFLKVFFFLDVVAILLSLMLVLVLALVLVLVIFLGFLFACLVAVVIDVVDVVVVAVVAVVAIAVVIVAEICCGFSLIFCYIIYTLMPTYNLNVDITHV
jgi:hypothetical protein